MDLSLELPPDLGADPTPSERAVAWRESVFDLPLTPPLSDQAISRESIYGARRWMSVLVDTNVLLRRTQPGHACHLIAVESVARLLAANSKSRRLSGS